MDHNEPLFLYFPSVAYKPSVWPLDASVFRTGVDTNWQASHEGIAWKIDIHAVKREYDLVSSLTSEAAVSLFRQNRDAFRDGHRLRTRFGEVPTPVPIEDAAVSRLINSLDERGAWVTDVEFLDTLDWEDNPRLTFSGINTETYVTNMHTLLSYLKNKRKGARPH